MGNRSSSHYPPPPHWMHQRTSYSTSASPYPEAKRPLGPGAFAEPYLSNTPNKQQMRRSVISLNATDGFRNPNRGSRISLNQMDFDYGPPPGPRLIIPPDAKTLKKLEKMEKKHQKLLKKLGARGIPLPIPPPPPPQMHPMFTRTMSFDDINRAHHNHNHPNLDPDFNGVRMRQRRPDGDEWRSPPRREMHSQYVKQQNEHNFSSNSTRRTGGSLASSSSPMTSSEEGGHSTDPWNSSSISSGRGGGGEAQRHHVMSPPMYSSTPHGQSQPISKTIEVKVERTEKIEQTTMDQKQKQQQQSQPTHQIHNGNMYAQPIIRGQPSYASRTSSVTNNSLLKCDQSEIDFSWVNEEEDKLNQQEEDSMRNTLPEFYFGMDPPAVNNEEAKENNNSKRRSVLEKTAAFEVEARRADRKEPPFLSRSSHHLPQPDYSPLQIHTKELPGGPAERRIYRLQNQSKSQDDRKYRSSIAF